MSGSLSRWVPAAIRPRTVAASSAQAATWYMTSFGDHPSSVTDGSSNRSGGTSPKTLGELEPPPLLVGEQSFDVALTPPRRSAGGSCSGEELEGAIGDADLVAPAGAGLRQLPLDAFLDQSPLQSVRAAVRPRCRSPGPTARRCVR